MKFFTLLLAPLGLLNYHLHRSRLVRSFAVKAINLRTGESVPLPNEGKYFRLVPIDQIEAMNSNDSVAFLSEDDDEREASADSVVGPSDTEELDLELAELKQELEVKTQIIKGIQKDSCRHEVDKIICMLFEAYQKTKPVLFAKVMDAKGPLSKSQMENYLKAIRAGSAFPNNKLLHWMARFEDADNQRFWNWRDFRNNICHYTISDTEIIRQWRSRLMKEMTTKDSNWNKSILEAAIEASNQIIELNCAMQDENPKPVDAQEAPVKSQAPATKKTRSHHAHSVVNQLKTRKSKKDAKKLATDQQEEGG